MSARSRQALAVYREARTKDQLGYYRRTSLDYERATAQSIAVAAVLLSLTTLAGTLAGLDIAGNLGWAIAAAVIPAVSTALAAYEALLGFERIAKLYADAVRSLNRLEEADLTAAIDDTAAAAGVATYAGAVEEILRKEQAQWGQLTAEFELPGSTDAD